jgi:hypothetical protein
MDGWRHVFSMAMVFGYVSPVSYGLIPTWHLQRELYKVLRAVCNYHGSGYAHMNNASVSQYYSDSAAISERELDGHRKAARMTQQCMDYNTVIQSQQSKSTSAQTHSD